MTTNNNPAQPVDVAGVLDRLFDLLERDSRGRWCFKSLSQDASKFDRVMESLNAARATQPATTPSDSHGWPIEQRGLDDIRQALEKLNVKSHVFGHSCYFKEDVDDVLLPITLGLVTPTPPDVAERARRAVEVFNEYLVTDFEPTLTADKEEALRCIIAAEFRGEERQ